MTTSAPSSSARMMGATPITATSRSVRASVSFVSGGRPSSPSIRTPSSRRRATSSRLTWEQMVESLNGASRWRRASPRMMSAY